MATIYPTANYNYITTTTSANTNAYVDGSTIAFGGGYGYVTEEKKNVVSGTDLAQALFVLNKKLRKKYKEDTNQFIADVMAAATHSEGEEAFWKLNGIVGDDA